MPGLDSYLVSLGVKGQDVVLSTMDKIRKEGKNLSKTKTAVSLAAKPSTSGGAASLAEKSASADTTIKSNAIKDQEKKDEQNKKFGEVAKKFGEGVKSFGAAAATLDPTATIQSFTTAVGTTLSGISVLGVSLGRLPEGIAALSNTTLSMAKNSVDMAKQSTLAYHQLADRNAATAHYGGNVKNSGQLSRAEMAGLVGAVSGSMGVVQEPLAAEISKLMSTKDTGALARVSAGDWESTGTNKGWILQQITNGMSGMPPSVKQAIQASLLSENSDIIQDYNSDAGQKSAQDNARRFSDRGEYQTAALYQGSLGDNGATKASITDMETGLNKMQLELEGVGLKFAGVITTMTNTIAGLPEEIEKTKKSLREFAQTMHIPAAALPSSLRAGQ